MRGHTAAILPADSAVMRVDVRIAFLNIVMFNEQKEGGGLSEEGEGRGGGFRIGWV